MNGGQVPTSAQAHGLHTYAISFIPKDPKPHEVELKFNGENVPGKSFTFYFIFLKVKLRLNVYHFFKNRESFCLSSD